MKKIISLLLCIIFMFTALPLNIDNITANALTSRYYTYSVSAGKATITDVDTSISGDITIPSTLGGYPVTSIGDSAFSWFTSLTSITLPDSVTSIGDSAFYLCVNLTSITIPDSVKSIGKYAFEDCDSLTSITIPDSVKSIGKYAFEDCDSLTSITIPDSVTSIGDGAFEYCYSLTSVTIGDSVKSIGDFAFGNCDSLTSITLPDSVKSIGDSAFYFCDSLTSITLPDSVTSIGDGAFEYCFSLTSITIPDSVKSIGDFAFGNCDSLTSITIPDSVTSIGDGAFEYCNSLTSVTIGDSVKSIGDGAFEYCNSLTSVTIGDSVKSIGDFAFEYCDNLTNAHYCGTEKQWKNVFVGSNNYNLTDALHYNNEMKKATCTKQSVCQHEGCGATRTTSHNYKTVTKKSTITQNGKKQYKCKVCGYVSSKSSTIYRPYSFKLSTTSYTYDGKAKKPTVTVKDSSGKTISSSKYTVTYPSGRKNVGSYKVKITFKGNYSGTKYLTFKINPPKSSVSKVTAGKKSLKVYVLKKSTQVTGYQIYYSTSKSFKTYKSKYITSYKTTSTTLKSLKAKKTYYVKVRTYKTVSGVKYYSGWSTVKYKKTK